MRDDIKINDRAAVIQDKLEKLEHLRSDVKARCI